MPHQRKVDVRPQCERCWITDNSVWDPQVTDTGEIVAYFKEIALPVATGPYVVADCASCGQLTVAGLYVEVEQVVLEAPGTTQAA